MDMVVAWKEGCHTERAEQPTWCRSEVFMYASALTSTFYSVHLGVVTQTGGWDVCMMSPPHPSKTENLLKNNDQNVINCSLKRCSLPCKLHTRVHHLKPRFQICRGGGGGGACPRTRLNFQGFLSFPIGSPAHAVWQLTTGKEIIVIIIMSEFSVLWKH